MVYFYTYNYYTHKLPLYGTCFSVHDKAAGITTNRLITYITKAPAILDISTIFSASFGTFHSTYYPIHLYSSTLLLFQVKDLKLLQSLLTMLFVNFKCFIPIRTSLSRHLYIVTTYLIRFVLEMKKEGN
ncbi:hypothetical protein CKR_2626 [Clostridium kluyveri NBRC 12016]|uniref:Uncharacterized protein n=2 Tax=Clostridium kluyveri TaxID=1534 RepID=A5N1I2_CLOK5|nr:Hypothetical protein CKL_2969 [Clostridium kluyveri DSM 555]BAH07677.1 hypothetical protein CKR_2626 [Clostridium kluyveri NBRC 12016]